MAHSLPMVVVPSLLLMGLGIHGIRVFRLHRRLGMPRGQHALSVIMACGVLLVGGLGLAFVALVLLGAS